MNPSPRLQSAILVLGVIGTLLAAALACSPLGPSQQELATQTALVGLRASVAALNDQGTSTWVAQAATSTLLARQLLDAHATATADTSLTATAIANATATAQSIVASADVPATWRLVTYDTFTSSDISNNIWPTGHDIGNQWADVQFGIDHNTYVWTAKSRQGFTEWIYPRGLSGLDDFYASVKVGLSSDEPAASYGLVFRVDPRADQLYDFEVNEGGPYGIFIQNKGVSSTLRMGTTAQVVKGGNTIAVRGIGSHFTFYVNHQQVSKVDDSRLTNGVVGLAIGISHRGVEMTFNFQDFVVLAP